MRHGQLSEKRAFVHIHRRRDSARVVRAYFSKSRNDTPAQSLRRSGGAKPVSFPVFVFYTRPGICPRPYTGSVSCGYASSINFVPTVVIVEILLRGRMKKKITKQIPSGEKIKQLKWIIILREYAFLYLTNKSYFSQYKPYILGSTFSFDSVTIIVHWENKFYDIFFSRNSVNII